MLKKFIAFFVSFSFFCHSTNILAQKKTSFTQENYKEVIYKTFSAAKKIKKPSEKRSYLEKVLKKINTELEKVDCSKLQKKEAISLLKVKKHFLFFEKSLPDVKNEDLDSFSDFIIQQTEQAFFICFVLPAIIFAVLITAVAVGFYFFIKHLKKKEKRILRNRQIQQQIIQRRCLQH